MSNQKPLEILECTVRDGNYSVNFKFTEKDTRILTQKLSDLGFKYIEIGHGLGLGASDAGKGKMTGGDNDMIRAAKEVAGNSLVGSFCIPGISDKAQIKPAAEAGLDFIRIGHNADTVEKTFDFVEEARKHGVVPFVNMMKTYAITPKEFAQKCQDSMKAGAEAAYFVDSSGGVFPDQLKQYILEAKNLGECRLGFHGHNNLMMAISNCLMAYECGVEFLDTTLCGLGRSAGNAPTEILIASLEKNGVKTGYDLFKVMDVVESYMWPLVSKQRAHDMMGIAAGYGDFHSSFLPKVKAVAKEHNAELRRLVSLMGQNDPNDLHEDYLEEKAIELKDTASIYSDASLLDFSSGKVNEEALSLTNTNTKSFLDGLVALSSKSFGSQVALEIAPLERSNNVSFSSDSDSLMMTEFVYNDATAVIGRVTIGNTKDLDEIIENAKNNISYFLISTDTTQFHSLYNEVLERLPKEKVFSFSRSKMRGDLFSTLLSRIALTEKDNNTLIYGYHDLMSEGLNSLDLSNNAMIFSPAIKPEAKIPVIESLRDWEEINLTFQTIICAATPNEDDFKMLEKSVANDGKIIALGRPISLPAEYKDRVKFIDLNRAYSGLIQRVSAVERLLS